MARSSKDRKEGIKGGGAIAELKPRDAEAGLGPLVWIPVLLHMIFLAAVVLSMTALTHNLDDIKMTLFLIFGAIMAVAGTGCIAYGIAPMPPRWVTVGLVAYLLAMCVSSAASEFSWVCWREVVFMASGYGFFLGANMIGSRWKTAHVFTLFLAWLLLAVNLFGFFQYDLFGNQHAGIALLYQFLYGSDPTLGPKSMLHSLLFTFTSSAQWSMISTALNRDFYAAFCLLYFPTAAALALISRRKIEWGLGIFATMLSIASIFLCKSKGEYFFAAASVLLFTALFVLAVRKVEVPTAYIGAWVGGLLILLVSLFWVSMPTLTGQLKSLDSSFASRKIIFAGGVKLFEAFPAIGSGPGTFVIYFPRYRAPDYYLHEISNVTERAHNYILDIFCETGLFGAVTFGIFAFSLACLAFRMVFKAEDRHIRMILIASLCGLFGMYGSNMTSTSGRWPIGAVGLWTYMGLISGLIRQGEGWVSDADRTGRMSFLGFLGPRRNDAAESGPTGWIRRYAHAIAYTVLIAAAIEAFVAGYQGSQYWRSALAYNDGLVDFERITQLYQHEVNDPSAAPERRRYFAETLHRSEAGFLRAIAIDPCHLSSYYKLGSVQNMLANVEPDKQEAHLLEARNTYLRLSELSPDYAEIHYNFGIVNYRLAQLAGRKIAELASKTNGIQPTPLSPNTPNELNAVSAQKAELERLMEEKKGYEERSRYYFEKMSAMSNKSDVFLNLGDTYFRGGQFDQAQKIFQKAMKVYPHDINFAKGFYGASFKLNDYAGQVEGLKAQWLLKPAERVILYEALQVALQRDLTTQFDELVKLALERNPVDPMIYQRVAEAAEKRKDSQALLEAATAYLKLARDKNMNELVEGSKGFRPEIMLKGAQAAESAGNRERAREFYAYLAEVPSPLADQAKAWLNANPKG